jgi:hypothetical protein
LGWFLSIVFGGLAYYYFHKGKQAHNQQLQLQKIQLEVQKISRVLDDDYIRSGQRRGIMKFREEDGWPYIAWVVGAEPPPQGR